VSAATSLLKDRYLSVEQFIYGEKAAEFEDNVKAYVEMDIVSVDSYTEEVRKFVESEVQGQLISYSDTAAILLLNGDFLSFC